MNTSAAPSWGTDLRGLLRLGVDATIAVTDLVEAMHHTIASGTGIVAAAPSGSTGGLTGLVYRAVRGSTRLVGHGLDAGLGAAAAALPATEASWSERETALAIVNGVWGDHLAATNNPLAIRMALRQGGVPLELTAQCLSTRLPRASGRVLVLVHGLCMNDLQWRRHGHDHGELLARTLDCTPLYLHYNSGLHVSHNGRDFADRLEQLLAAWPVPVRELVIVGHSMGGLVTRSACHHAARQGRAWLRFLKSLVFLGTPHHGAPLERGGRLVDTLLGISPYVAPFSRLSRARSAGITDLRYGNLQDADWQGRDRHDQHHDDRQPVPLPRGVRAHVVAATRAERVDGLRARLHDRFIGDGLVPLASALGEHDEPARRLGVPPARRMVLTGAGHWDLLSRGEVGSQLVAWLDRRDGRRPGRQPAHKAQGPGSVDASRPLI